MATRIVLRLVAAAAMVTAAALDGAAQKTTAFPPTSLLAPTMSGMDNFMLYCAPCHGRDAKGGARNNGAFPADSVRRFVTNGGLVSAHGSTEMPVWGPTFRSLDSSDKLVDIRIANVVSYLESIQQ
jgi:mono/diheme cytochrome c family protein